MVTDAADRGARLVDRLRDRLLGRPWIGLVVALAVHTALWLLVQRDLATVDPLYYASNGHAIAFHPADLVAARHGPPDIVPFAMRLGLIGPMALVFRLLGTSPLTTNLPSLVAGLAILVVAYAAPATPRGKWIAMALGLVCTPLVTDGHELTADLPCAAALAGSILCLARRDRPRGAWWLVGAAALWFWAFQIKEVAVWCAPAWIYAAVVDLRGHGARWVVRRFAPAVGVGAALAAGYLALCAALWGEPLARFHALEEVAAEHTWSLVGHPAREWVARLVWEPPLLLERMFRWMLVPAVLSPWLVRGRDRIWIVATASIVVLYWFGSTNLASYMPLPSHRRMLLPALPGLLVLAALSTDAAVDQIARRLAASSAGRGRRAWWQLGLAVAFVALFAVPHVSVVRRYVLVDRPERAAYAALRAEVASTADPIVLVCGDLRCPEFTDFYFGFERPARLTTVLAPAFAAAPPPVGARVRVLAHRDRSGGPGREVARRAEAIGLGRIAWHPEVQLYDAGDGARLHEALARP
jgi:hypothetical protein